VESTRVSARRLGGRYELDDVIGRGATATVWRAHDVQLGRQVAVKEIRVSPAADERERESARARFRRETRVAARLSHAGAVRIFDAFDVDECLYLVMELVDAPDLHTLVREQGPLAPPVAARIGAALADVLAHAHGNGLVHRDVKPANVLVPDRGAVKLADFGIASLAGDPRITTTGLVVGSPGYMAPEQARGERVGAEADVWALGATLYYAVEGCGPFEREGAVATLTAIVTDPPRPTRRAGPLAEPLFSMLQKDASRRPSVAALRERLSTVSDAPSSGATVELVAAPTMSVKSAAVPTGELPTARPRRRPRRGARVATAVVGIGLAATVVVAALSSRWGDTAGLSPTTTGPATTAAVTVPPAPATTATPAADPPARGHGNGHGRGHDKG
jgi:serine/threonine protein kinase